MAAKRFQTKRHQQPITIDWRTLTNDWTDLVEDDVDWADVGGADCSHREEAVFPTTDVDSALIEAEDTLQPARYAGVHTEQLACNTDSSQTVQRCPQRLIVTRSG